MPLAYAGQFYVLREHIGFVRERLTSHDHDAPAGPSGANGPPQAHADAAPPAGDPPRATPGSA